MLFIEPFESKRESAIDLFFATTFFLERNSIFRCHFGNVEIIANEDKGTIDLAVPVKVKWLIEN
jgi:hypothetical protein